MTKKELRTEISELRKRILTLENKIGFISNALGFVNRSDTYSNCLTHGAYGSLPQKFYELLAYLKISIMKPIMHRLEVRKIKENKTTRANNKSTGTARVKNVKR